MGFCIMRVHINQKGKLKVDSRTLQIQTTEQKFRCNQRVNMTTLYVYKQQKDADNSY